MSRLSHIGPSGRARMVDVSDKATTARRAIAEGFVRIGTAQLEALDNLPKGDPVEVAQVAGILGGKKTSELIPMCHPLPLTHLSVEIDRIDDGFRIVATAKADALTGVEMEALTAVSIAALALYDMLKSAGSDITIEQIRLLEKTGGKRDWKRV